MNKKAMMLTITLLAAVLLVTPLVGTAQACWWRHRRTIEPYYVEYVVMQIQPPTIEEKGDYRIIKGGVSQGAYDGPLGTGTMTAELIIWVINTATGKAWSTFKNTLVIDSGSYGAGTLVGFSWFKYENSAFPFSGRTFLCGTGDLRGVSISAEKTYGPNPGGGATVVEDGWITHP